MNRLFIDELTSIGVVGKGDNPDADILFYKSANTESVEQIEGDSMSMPDLSGLTPELQKAIDDHIAEAIAAANGATPAESVLPDDLPAPVLKALTEKDEALAQERAEREALQAEVSKMRDEQLSERFTKRAGELASVLGSGEEVPQILKDLHVAAPDAYAKLEALIGDAAKIIVTSDRLMLKELGTSNDESDPHSKITTIAKAIHKEERDEFPTLAAAKAEAWRRNPDLKADSRKVN